MNDTPARLLILDKSWVRGTSQANLLSAARRFRLALSEQLFYEILTGDDALLCLRRLRQVQDAIVLLPGIGTLWRHEMDSGAAAGPLLQHAVSRKLAFNIHEEEGRLVLTSAQRRAIEMEREQRDTVGPGLDMATFRTLSRIFPELAAAVKGGQRDGLTEFERAIADDHNLVRDLYESSRQPAWPDAALISPEWFCFRRIQTLLLAGLEFVRAHGVDFQGHLPQGLPNFVNDLPYVTLGALERALATREPLLERWLLLLAPDSVVEH